VREHIGFDDEERWRQDVGNQVLAVNDLFIDRAVDLEPLERRLL
jgi:hypothetical protein